MNVMHHRRHTAIHKVKSLNIGYDLQGIDDCTAKHSSYDMSSPEMKKPLTPQEVL
jgi:hypothetical protein